MNPKYDLVAQRAAMRCEYCRAPQSGSNLAHEVEHIIPLADEGSSASSNLALACRAFNLFKGASRTGLDPETGQRARLFHPRTDSWFDHFRFDDTTCELRGLTDVGRATVQRLQLNSKWQLVAREFWAESGRYP
jgi:hypothetical protein